MTHRAAEPVSNSKIFNLVLAIGTLVNAVVDLLPTPVADRVHSGRKAVVGAAGSAATLLTALHGFPLPANATSWVAGALVVLTGVSTWAVPNAQ